ncbi:MAG: prolyl oligopeptidase family serine peptidase [Candidatus Melainabacteria bacterium]|nr:prolyl oligopeptidase family serine peptidase [Candidatus Melainabacteria bacterium]
MKSLLIIKGLTTLTLFFLLTFVVTNPISAKVTHILIHTAKENLSTVGEHNNNNKPVDLVFYLNGGGSAETLLLADFPFGGLNIPDLNNVYRKDLVFVSFAYDPRFHWSNPEIVRDVVENIHEISSKFNTRKIFIVGISVGGALALNILSNADRDLKDKITNVLAMFPIIDYDYTFSTTKRENIYTLLKEYFDKFENPKEQMKLSSPVNYISGIPSHTEITLIEGTNDTHIPPEQIEDYYNKLKELKRNVKLLKFNTDHLSPGKEFGEVIQALLK